MKVIKLVCLFFITFALPAQQTISGTFSPAKEYNWMIAYLLKPGSKTYIADTEIKQGRFTLNFPENSPPGTYRVVYAVPEDAYYFDVIYNGKEKIELTFDAINGVSFLASKENQLFNAYFKEINHWEQEIITFYSQRKTDKETFKKLVKQMQATQSLYEIKSENLLVHNFIAANKPYFPKEYKPIQKYISHKKKHYFNFLKIDNPVLKASPFLTDKFSNYVFTALPLIEMTSIEKEKNIQKNIHILLQHLEKATNEYKLHILYSLWKDAAANNYNDTSNFIYNTQLKSLATITQNNLIINEIETHNRLRLGAIAPDITWKEEATSKKLSETKEAEQYLLIFWSSSCSHCLKEIPSLHEKLGSNKSIKIIAIGLEDDATNWKKETANLKQFSHVIALGKWESNYSILYAINSTPSYFILDKDKRIIAKPEHDKDVLQFFKDRN